MPGMFDQAKAMLKARKVQSDLAKTEIEAVGGDNQVTVVFTGDMKLKSIVISEAMLEADKKYELERMIKDTITQAMQQAQSVAAEKTKAVMKELGISVPGL